jgi:hypothetical protein
MYFRLGGAYTHPSAELMLQSSRMTDVDQAGRPYQYTDRWNLIGQLQYSGVSLLAAQQALMLAYRDDIVRLQPFAGLYYDNGQPSAYYWNAFNSLGGIRCPQGPNFPKGDAQQWVNARDYDIQLEATFPTSLQSNTLEWSETLTIQGGGGQRIVGIENRYDTPIIQRVSRATPVVYTQEGRAKGRYFYPKPPIALSPSHLNSPDCSVNRVTPRLQAAGGYFSQTDYVVTWRYVMIMENFTDASPIPWNGS